MSRFPSLLLDSTRPRNRTKPTGILVTAVGQFRILASLGYAAHPFFDDAVTPLVISDSTKSINSILNFLGYTKEKQNAKESGRSTRVHA